MNKSDLIIAYLSERLETINIPCLTVDKGFLAHYQEKLTEGQQVLVIQQLSDGPFTHKSCGGGSSTLSIVVGGLVAFDSDAMTNLRTLLKETRTAIFDKEDRHFKLGGLLSSPMTESEPTPLRPPQEGQENAHFALPLSLQYTEIQ